MLEQYAFELQIHLQRDFFSKYTEKNSFCKVSRLKIKKKFCCEFIKYM